MARCRNSNDESTHAREQRTVSAEAAAIPFLTKRDRGILGMLLALLLVPAFATADLASSRPPQSSSATPQMERLAEVVLDFRRDMMQDYRSALAEHTSAGAKNRFETLDRAIWYGIEPRVGWAYFVNVSVVAFAAPPGPGMLVGFFNPWCDAVLVTAWQESASDRPTLVDAEIVAADWLREGRLELELRPGWVRTRGFRPLAAVTLLADSIRAFENVFAAAGDADWRESLPLLSDSVKMHKVNYPAIAGRLLGNLSSIRDFVTPLPGEDPRLNPLRKAVTRAMAQGAAGDVAGLLGEATESLPEVKAALKAVPPTTFEQLIAVAMVLADDGCLVLMVPQNAPGLVFSFFLRNHPVSTVSLKRIDVLYLPAVLDMRTLPGSKVSEASP